MSSAMHRTDTQVSRRSFLKAGAIATSAAALGATATAFADEATDGDAEETADDQWDDEADIVIVGSGTVAVAAMAASYYGAGKIIMLEKMGYFGGTTIYSGQGMGIPLNHLWAAEGIEDSLEDVLTYYKVASGGRADLAVGESYATNGDAFLCWLEEAFGMTLGFSDYFGPTQRLFYGDYYNPCEGYLGIGRNPVVVSAIEGEEDGATEWSYFRSRIEEDENIDLRLNTPATSLVTDDEGAVIGVVAEGEDGEVRIKANKAVILGTGGFEHDADMRRQYLSMPLIGLCSCSGNTGDGQKMGQAIGADLAYMDRCWGLPHIYLGEGDPTEMVLNDEVVDSLSGSEAVSDANMYRGYPGSVVVNAKGLRIGNECSSYDTFNRSLGNFDSGDNAQSSVGSFLVFDSTYAAPFGAAGLQDDGTLPDAYVQADTLEELAEALGIDQDNFIATMTAFNENAANGVDPVYHRGEYDYDINTTGGYMDVVGAESGTSNKVLSPVATAPFYGVRMVPGTFGTNGGLRIDANSQVLSVSGETIPGLYAVGNCSSGVAGGIYAHGGMTVGSGSVMSWVAVRHILGIED